MLEINKTISITGFSSIEVTENGNKTTKQVAYMNAIIPKDGDLSINKSVQDRNLFSKYSDVVINDFNEFEKHVYNLSKGMNYE